MTKQELRNHLVTIFKDLRGMGIMARVNFSCCQNCGCYELWEKARSNYHKVQPFGYVFWHHQDEEDLRKHGRVYLSFGAFTDDKGDKEKPKMKSKMTSVEVGKLVVSQLKKKKIKVEWDGTDDIRILVGV